LLQNNQEQPLNVEDQKVRSFYDFLNSDNFKKTLETIIISKQASNSTFISAYRLDPILVFVILGGVIFASYHSLNDKVSTGTLIGAIVGYVSIKFIGLLEA